MYTVLFEILTQIVQSYEFFFWLNSSVIPIYNIQKIKIFKKRKSCLKSTISKLITFYNNPHGSLTYLI